MNGDRVQKLQDKGWYPGRKWFVNFKVCNTKLIEFDH